MPKFELTFKTPILNAAGSLGFCPDPYGPVDLSQFGAFLTNPISLKPHPPAHDRNCQSYPGGFILHTGHSNPGFRAALRQNRRRWALSSLPVVVHLLIRRAAEAAEMVQRLEEVEGVMGIELGLPPDVHPDEAREIVQASAGELPLLVRLPLDRAVELAGCVLEMGASAASLGPPRGLWPLSRGGFLAGRLYGPGLFPLSLQIVRTLAKAGLPVIGGVGVYGLEDVEAMLSAGALAVQLDSVLWREGGLPGPASDLEQMPS
jgi:dihydroorotate dehydrogenase (NAD+) catalytic subunit